MFLLSSFGGKGETKFKKWERKFRQWFWDDLPVTNSKFSVPTEKVFCFNCKHYFFDRSRHDSAFRCKEPSIATYKNRMTDNPINPGGTFELAISKDCWKVNKNNDCKYHKEV